MKKPLTNETHPEYICQNIHPSKNHLFYRVFHSLYALCMTAMHVEYEIMMNYLQLLS